MAGSTSRTSIATFKASRDAATPGLAAVLELTVGGANTATEFADVSVELSY